MRGTMSILGLYNYDASIFDMMGLPVGVDRDCVIDLICSECAELEVLYPEPKLMKQLIGKWSTAKQYKWRKLWNTLSLEYNPIDNYSMTETRSSTRSGTENETRTLQKTGQQTDEGKNGGTSVQSGTDTTERSVTAFNQESYAPESKTVESPDLTRTDNFNDSNNRTYNEHNDDVVNRNSDGTETETLTRLGNIGVTTSQQMIESEREIANFDFYEVVVGDFKEKFCLEVY